MAQKHWSRESPRDSSTWILSQQQVSSLMWNKTSCGSTKLFTNDQQLCDLLSVDALYLWEVVAITGGTGLLAFELAAGIHEHYVLRLREVEQTEVETRMVPI